MNKFVLIFLDKLLNEIQLVDISLNSSITELTHL